MLPDIRSVGVMGDERTYAHPVIIRAVTSEDAMTADWARLPYDVMETMSSRIINEVAGINRVAYDITSKPPGTSSGSDSSSTCLARNGRLSGRPAKRCRRQSSASVGADANRRLMAAPTAPGSRPPRRRRRP